MRSIFLILAFLFVIVALIPVRLCALAEPCIYPLPQQVRYSGERVEIAEGVRICLPAAPSDSDSLLAQFLAADLVDRFGVAPAVEQCDSPPDQRFSIVLGAAENPLVQKLCCDRGESSRLALLEREGYLLVVDARGVLVAGSDEPGAFYGLQSLRQLLHERDGAVYVRAATVLDRPILPFRGIRLHLPGREHIPFFKRFIRDFMCYFKYNRLVVEINANMRLRRHPELNAGAIDFSRDLAYSRRDRPEGPNGEYQNSSHYDAGDGGIVEQEEVRELVRYARRHFIDVIPEVPCLTHSYYLLTRHRELAEISDAEWPDTYCPSNPESYRLLYDVFDEIIEVMTPKIMHIGHDEWRMPLDRCPRCEGKDYRKLFLQDLDKIHGYLTSKGIRVAMWGDHLLESIRNRGRRDGLVADTGFEYQRPGALTPEQVRSSVPKDILIFNWCWNEKSNRSGRAIPNRGIHNDIQFEEWGFEQVYGNFTPNISQYEKRLELKGLIGGAPSSWIASTPFNFGKGSIRDFLGCANLLWSEHRIESDRLTSTVTEFLPTVRRALTGEMPPSRTEERVRRIDLARYTNISFDGAWEGGEGLEETGGSRASGQEWFQLVLGEPAGSLRAVAVGVSGKAGGPGEPGMSEAPGVSGESGTGYPAAGPVIAIGADATSLIFVHACARPGQVHRSTRMMHNTQDTAELLGWHEIRYADGYIETVPVRYGINIGVLDDGPAVCYQSDAFPLEPAGSRGPRTLYLFEWTNTRPGVTIESVQLKGSKGFVDYSGNPSQSNAVYLFAVSEVVKREP